MIYDILTTVPVGTELNFVAATPGPNSVAFSLAVPVQMDAIMGPVRWFQAGDNVMLRAIRVPIPYGFGTSTYGRINFVWLDDLGASGPISELGNGSGIVIPNVCDGLEFGEGGLFVQVPKSSAGRVYVLMLSVLELGVSMVNLPVSLNGVTVTIPVHAEVLHTVPLVASP